MQPRSVRWQEKQFNGLAEKRHKKTAGRTRRRDKRKMGYMINLSYAAMVLAFSGYRHRPGRHHHGYFCPLFYQLLMRVQGRF